MNKVTLKRLRALIREEITKAYSDQRYLGSNDDEMDVGVNVAVVNADGRPDVGKVVNRYAGQKGKDAVWSVKTHDGKTLQKRAGDLKKVEEQEPGEVEKHDEPEDSKTPVEKNPDDLLLDDNLREIDEKREEESFKDRHYEFMAKQILFKWSDHSPEVSWKAVADNYVKSTKATTGKVLDSSRLYIAIQDALVDMENCRNDGTYSKNTDKAT